MDTKVQQSLETILKNWQAMQSGTMDDPDSNADNAELFETNFYRFINVFKDWFDTLESRPKTLEEALSVDDIDAIITSLPTPLYLPFETELEMIVEGRQRTSDEKYD